MKVDLILKKIGYKRNLICLGGPGSSKIILTLLKKVIRLYIKPTIINVKELGFKFILEESSFLCLGLEDQLNDLVQAFLCKLDNVRSFGWWSLRRLSKSFGGSNMRLV